MSRIEAATPRPWPTVTVWLSLACLCFAASGTVLHGRSRAAAAPQAPAGATAPLDLARFEKDIVAFEQADRTAPPPQGGILFVGSSIFRQWASLTDQMAPLPVFNRAFGGSRTAEQLHYMDRIVLPYRPRVIVYYCGSNDVNAGERAATIAGNFETFSERVRAALPDTRVYFASIIKAPQKRDRWDVVDAANARVRSYASRTPGRGYIDLHPALESAPGQPRMDLYLPDRLHYLPPAYERLATVVKPVIERAWAEVAGKEAAVPAAALTVPTQHDAHRLHNDPTAYMASLDDPARDAWQKPHEVVMTLDLKPGMIVADIGAGSGYFTLRFARHVGDGSVLAVDVSQPMLDEVNKRAGAASLGNVRTILARPDDPQLPAAGVDVVFICDTWHHVDQRPAYLAKVRRALKQGGRFVIVDFKKDAPVGPPASMKLARADVLAEVQAAGFTLAGEPTMLPHQYFLVFTVTP